MLNLTKKFSYLMLCALLALSCNSDNDRETTDSTENPEGGGGGGGGNGGGGNGGGNVGGGREAGYCIQTGVAENLQQLGDYYRYSVAGDGNRDSSPSWTSLELLNPAELSTDGRLRVRVIVRPNPPPGQDLVYSANPSIRPESRCPINSFPYLRLKMKIGARRVGQTNGYEQVISIPPVHVDSGDNSVCSDIFDFNMNQFGPTSYVIFDIFDVDWDRCNNGYQPSSESPVCPYNNVFDFNCFEIELQVVTDSTYNFRE